MHQKYWFALFLHSSPFPFEVLFYKPQLLLSMKSIFMSVLLCVAHFGFAQIYTFTNNTSGTANSVAANATATSLSRVNGANAPGSPCGTGFNATNFSAVTTYASSLAATSVTITPAAGCKLIVTDFSVGLRRSASGPASVRLAYSVDGGTTWIDKGTNDAPNNGSCGVTATATWDPADFDVTSNTNGIIFRIYGFNASSTGGILQLLNLTINGSVGATCVTPAAQPTSLLLTPSLTSIAGSFTGTTPASSYLVVVSTSSSLTQTPNTGDIFAVDDILGNATVVSTGSSTSFTASNLNPGTAYYFFVFAYNSSGLCYNTTSPLNANTVTTTPPACTAPTQSVTNVSAPSITSSSIDLSYTRGNGDNVLVIARASSAVNATPINSVNYTVGTQIGSGNFVAYNGSAANFSYTGLNQNTAYYFSFYEYNNLNYCYEPTPVSASFTTLCSGATNVSSAAATGGNGIASINWTNPSSSCLTEIIVVASNAPITAAGNTFSAAANSVYVSPNQVVYRGTGTNITVSGLSNNTLYYFKIFTRNAAAYSSGIELTATPFDPSSTSYLYLSGNLHAHSSYSDGNQDTPTSTPKDDYEFARDANCMDFLGISEHNHSQAGMQLSNFALGYNQANQVNGVVSGLGNSIVTLYGMEWGVISGGGHVVVYGFDDQLVGWEAGNYNIYCAKNDYTSLFALINGQANAFGTLAHPSSSDYGGIASTYSVSADNAIVGAAVESGPATSTSVSYNSFPSSLGYLSYYKTMLAKGYHLGAVMDHDNHNMTFGKVNTNRTIVLATAKTRTSIVEAYRNMRFYASEDCNVKLDYKCGTDVMGAQLVKAGKPSLSLTVTDPDAGESVTTIELWGGQPGVGNAALMKTYSATGSITFTSSDVENVQASGTTYYYFFIITQGDGNKIVSSPIWYTRQDGVLPVTLTELSGHYDIQKGATLLQWRTLQEYNSKNFMVETSVDGRTWNNIGAVAAAGNSNSIRYYSFTDMHPAKGTNYYRLRMIDMDNSFQYSNIITVGNSNTAVYVLYPNPAGSIIYITTNSSTVQRVQLSLLDNAGKVVREQQGVVQNRLSLPVHLNGVAKGIYFLNINDGVKNSVQQLIVQ
jgi:hypothetical protein